MQRAPAMAFVLAAGKGTRMKSDLPKVLVPVCGRPMVRYVLEALRLGGVSQLVVVVGYEADRVKTELADVPDVQFALQEQQLGTGHAVMVCRDYLAGREGPVVVVAGDSPMLRPASVKVLLDAFDASGAACVLGTARKDNPAGFGRVVRDGLGNFTRIVEERDATPDQRAITEVNVSTYVFDAPALLASLDRLQADNAQREYYITDCPAILLDAGKQVLALEALSPAESLSVNSVEDLAQVEQELQRLSRATNA